jgi:3-oxoisoapionate decarboxylase
MYTKTNEFTPRLGIGSYTYAWAAGVSGHPPERPLTPFDLIDRAAEQQIGVVQMADNLPLHHLPDPELLRIGAYAAEKGIELETGTRDIRPAHLKNYIRISRLLNVSLLRTVIDTADFHPTPEEAIKTIRESIDDLESANVCMAIENHDRFKSAVLAAMIRELDSPRVGICLDTVNSMGAGEGVETVVGNLAPHTMNLHIKDFTVKRVPNLMGFTVEGTPAGQGMLDVPYILQKLAPYAKCRSAILEFWLPFENDLQTTLEKEKRWTQDSLQYLKPLF